MLKNSLLRLKEVAKETRDRYACGDNNLGDEKSNAFSAVIENISASFFLFPSPAKKKQPFFGKWIACRLLTAFAALLIRWMHLFQSFQSGFQIDH